MTNIIVAFSKQEDAKSIRTILVKNGFQVISVCTSGAQALNQMNSLSGGIIVCGFRFADMQYDALHDCLPKGFDMLLVASPSRWSGYAADDIVCLGMPVKVYDLVQTLDMMCKSQVRQKKKLKTQPMERSDEEKALIVRAKTMLMERNHMSETEAHRYIQKCSMDSATSLVETAQMVISLINV